MGWTGRTATRLFFRARLVTAVTGNFSGAEASNLENAEGA